MTQTAPALPEIEALLQEKLPDGSLRFSEDDVLSTLPLLVIKTLEIKAFDELPTEFQELATFTYFLVGLEPSMTAEAQELAWAEWFAKNPPHNELLKRLEESLQAALKRFTAEQQEAALHAGRQLKGESAADVAARTPKLGEKAPEGAVKVDRIAPRRRI